MSTPFFNISRSLTTAVRSKRRVVVTGIGVVCPLGVGTKNAWEALINSKCGITKLSEPDYGKLPCKVGKYFLLSSIYAHNAKYVCIFILYATSLYI